MQVLDFAICIEHIARVNYLLLLELAIDSNSEMSKVASFLVSFEDLSGHSIKVFLVIYLTDSSEKRLIIFLVLNLLLRREQFYVIFFHVLLKKVWKNL